MPCHVFTADLVRTESGIPGNAIVVEDGVVVAVGDRRELAGGGVAKTYPGAVLMPGLRDVHLHPVAYAAALRGATLAAATDFADIERRLRAAATALPEPTPIMGMRLNEETLAERRLPDRRVLDAAVDDRPVLVHRYCGHVAIANSAALAVGGVDATTPEPLGGVIDRGADGTPTGVLRETAIELVAEELGSGNRVSPVEVRSALGRLAAVGITSVGAMLRTGTGAWASLGNEVEAVATAAATPLPIKVGAYVIEESTASVAANKALIDEAGGRLRWLGIKRFGDGSFGGHTAAMHESFDDVDGTGTLRLAEIDRVIAETSLAAGGAVAIHAIGDRACGEVIDMFTDLIAAGAEPGKLRIEHASVLAEPDIVRMGRLGIIAAVQPPFLGSEAEWLGKRLGTARLERTYPFAAMEQAGVVLAGSSDCPVESPDPWNGMALAQDRAGMVPAQAISATRALAMYTAGGATALEELEPLAVGSPADFIVVDRDPVMVSPAELRRTEVLATYVDGAEVEVDGSQPLWLD